MPGDTGMPGILEALLERLDLAPWEIVDGATWRRAPLYRVGNRRAPETRRVLGLALLGKEREADVVVLVRDRDGDDDREAEIETGIAQAPAMGFTTLLVGGVAIEEIEAWILALLGDRNAENYARPKEKLAENHGLRTRAQKVAVIEGAALDRAESGAPSFMRFCERVRAALGSSAEGKAPQH
jgi:hypothetical protein